MRAHYQWTINIKAQLKTRSARPYHPSQFISESLYVVFDVALIGDFFELLHCDQNIARLNKNFCSQARGLTHFGVQFQAYLLKTEWDAHLATQNKHSTASITTTFAVEVNICSFRHHANQVGDLLSLAGLFLQDPAYDPGKAPYHNPQKLEFEGVEETRDIVSTPTYVSSEELARLNVSTDLKRFEQDHHLQTTDLVDSILNSLSHNNILHEISTDQNRIKSALYP